MKTIDLKKETLPQQNFDILDRVAVVPEQDCGDQTRVVTGVALFNGSKVVKTKDDEGNEKTEHVPTLEWRYILTPPDGPCQAKGAAFYKDQHLIKVFDELKTVIQGKAPKNPKATTPDKD